MPRTNPKGARPDNSNSPAGELDLGASALDGYAADPGKIKILSVLVVVQEEGGHCVPDEVSVEVRWRKSTAAWAEAADHRTGMTAIRVTATLQMVEDRAPTSHRTVCHGWRLV